jgi:hypothetical protein
MTNYQRTAAWLKAAGKEQRNAEHTSTAIGVHLEELREQLELMRVSQDGWAAVLERIVIDLRYLSEAIKTGKVVAHIPQHLRTDFLKELCDGKVTADGIAYFLGANMDEADKRVIDANWSKFDKDGKPVLLPGGKLGKSDLYRKADLKGLV